MQNTIRASFHRTKLPDIRAFEKKVYKDVQGLLVEQVKKACINSSFPFEELKAEADFLFSAALRRFDDERGAKFSTFLWVVVHNGLVDYGKQLQDQAGFGSAIRYEVPSEDETPPDTVDTLADPLAHRAYDFVREEFRVADFEHLTSDARSLAELVLLGFADSFEKVRKIAKQRLGWGEDFEVRFEEAVYDLQQLVKSW